MPSILRCRDMLFATSTCKLSLTSCSNGKSARQLREITRSSLNQKSSNVRANLAKVAKTLDTVDENAYYSDPKCVSTPKIPSSYRKRKALPTPPDSSPIHSIPSKRIKSRPRTPEFQILCDEDESADEPLLPALSPIGFPTRNRRIPATHTRVLERSFGGNIHLSRGGGYGHCTHWTAQTANFCTKANDVHNIPDAMPFCTASCNSKLPFSWKTQVLVHH
jgi:hypothetical protein